MPNDEEVQNLGNDIQNDTTGDLPQSTSDSQDQEVEEPWDFPEVGTMQEEKAKRVRLFAPTIYFVQCTDLKATKSKFPNQFTGEYEIQCTWMFKILKNIDGTEIMYNNGKAADKDLFPVWTPKDAMAMTKTGTAQATREIMTALRGLPSNAALGKPVPTQFIGKYARVTCQVGAKKDGSPKQIWSGWAPWDGKK